MNSLYTSGIRQTTSLQADLERLRNGDTSASLLGARNRQKGHGTDHWASDNFIPVRTDICFSGSHEPDNRGLWRYGKTRDDQSQAGKSANVRGDLPPCNSTIWRNGFAPLGAYKSFVRTTRSFELCLKSSKRTQWSRCVTNFIQYLLIYWQLPRTFMLPTASGFSTSRTHFQLGNSKYRVWYTAKISNIGSDTIHSSSRSPAFKSVRNYFRIAFPFCISLCQLQSRIPCFRRA